MSTPHSKPSPKRAKPGFHKLNEIIRTMAAAEEKNKSNFFLTLLILAGYLNLESMHLWLALFMWI